jgi:hypothetical protein
MVRKGVAHADDLSRMAAGREILVTGRFATPQNFENYGLWVNF